MRVTYRSHGGNQAYWQTRWDSAGVDTGELRLDRYPGKYVEQTLRGLSVPGPILEAGCGAGRIVRHYRNCGRDIIGVDFIASALQLITRADPTVPLVVADIEKLPFPNAHFAAVLAFGLYHNIENGPEAAFRETRRIIRSDGLLCAAMRLDNLQNRGIDWLAERAETDGPKNFHKLNYTKDEWIRIVALCGFTVEKTYFVENMPFLYKYHFFRSRSQKKFDETRARGEGYHLSPFGRALQQTVTSMFPGSFCNAIVIIARAAPCPT